VITIAEVILADNNAHRVLPQLLFYAYQVTDFHKPLPHYLYNIPQAAVKVNGFLVKGMSSLTDNFDFIFVGRQNMLCVALDTPHLPYSISMVIGRHNDEAMIRPVPFLVGPARIIVKHAN